MLRVIVLLEGESSAHFEVLSAVEQVFIKDLSVLSAYIFLLILTSLAFPAIEKHNHSMMLPPPGSTVGSGVKYLSKNILKYYIQLKSEVYIHLSSSH